MDIKIRMGDQLAHFLDEELPLGATLGGLLWALEHLTAVEFRMWLQKCEEFPGFHPSHFEGAEDRFIRTGSWEWEEE